MKYLVIFSLMSFSALAHDANGKPTVAEIKEKMTARLDSKISALQETKSCVSSAETHEALKACRQKMKEQHKAFKEDMKEKKEAFKAERKNKKKSK